MNERDLLRYSRQIMLPEVDIQGQQRLLAGHALIIGAGGLGSPAALYLAASGLGSVVLADDDRVELSNLQRQIGHADKDLGSLKAESLAQAMVAINPGCQVRTVSHRLEGDALAKEVAGADVVLDCTDRFKSRYAINAACRQARVALVSGAAIRFSGQLAVFDPGTPQAPCYACLYPPGGPEEEASCAESGVMAPLVGLIGSFQAIEAFKLISGAGRVHQGLSTFDGLTGQWRHFHVPPDPECPVCQALPE